MKFYYLVFILAQLLLAYAFRDENKQAYTLYLLKDIFAGENQTSREKKPSKISKQKKMILLTGEDNHTLFLERM